jgi:hypothetical protein
MSIPIPAVRSIRPFVPAKDFAQSKKFYQTLGFSMVSEWKGGALFSAGSQSFILQEFYQKELAENFMMQLTVENLDEWWAHIDGLKLDEVFGVKPAKAPAVQPWGLRVAYLFDPSPVLWHVVQA